MMVVRASLTTTLPQPQPTMVVLSSSRTRPLELADGFVPALHTMVMTLTLNGLVPRVMAPLLILQQLPLHVMSLLHNVVVYTFQLQAVATSPPLLSSIIPPAFASTAMLWAILVARLAL